MRFLLSLSLLGWLLAAQADGLRLLVQRSPLAGSQYYALDQCRYAMQVGDRLDLVREPDNRHDRHAIRVEWRGHPLGYVPRGENRIIAGAMDAGQRLVARLSALSDNENPWRRVAFEVFVEL